LFVALVLFLFISGPEIACQAPKRSNSTAENPQTRQDQSPARQKINPPKLEFSFTQFDRIKE
jgi:hypothetical protein